MSEANKAVVRQLFERADKSDITVMDDLIAPDYTDHNPPPFASQTPGLPGARETFEAATRIFSDWQHEVVQQLSDGDFVVTRVIGRGKHTGDFMGIPATGKDVQMEGITIHRVQDGKVVEHWAQVDGAGMLAQLGVLPPMGG